MNYWKNKKIIVTGGSGFLGMQIVDKLKKYSAEVFIPRTKKTNLIDYNQVMKFFEDIKPDIVIHGAAFYGGIGINQTYPGKIYYDNLIMGANTMEAARRVKCRKFVTIGTACSYPGYLKGELKEEDLWNGIPHETVVNYGLTKKMLAIQGLAYKKQYNFDSIHLILTNLYGPHDSYNPKRSHVVAALIRKFVEAVINNSEKVEVWGTGKPIREFLYVKDCADAILLAAEKYNDLTPLNIGTGSGISIKELAETIKEVTGFQGKVEWNTRKPDGQMKKVLDITRMSEYLNWKPSTSLKKGLEETIKWYKENKDEADKKW